MARKKKPERSEAQKAAAMAALEVAKVANAEKLKRSFIPAEVWASPTLAGFQRVYRNPKSHDKSEEDKNLRRYLQQQPRAFYDQMKGFEERDRPEEESKGPALVDAGSKRAIEHAEKLLKALLEEGDGK